MESTKKGNTYYIGVFGVVVAAILWSLDAIFRSNLYHLPAIVVVFIEHGIATVVLLPYFFWKIKSFKSFDKKQLLIIILIALISGVVGTLAYTNALFRIHYIPFSIVVLLQKLQPIFAIIASAILLKEKPSKRFFFLAIMALFFSYILAFPKLTVNFDKNHSTLIAAALAVLAAACWGSSTAFSKISLKNVSFIQTTFLRMFFTSIFSFVLISILGNIHALNTLTFKDKKYFLIIVFSTGLVAMLFYYFGLQKIPAILTTFLELIWPISAIFVDLFYFKKSILPIQYFAGACLIFTILLIVKEEQNQKSF